MRYSPIVGLLALIPAAAFATPDTPSRTLTVVNDTSAAVNQLFVAGGRTKGWRGKVAGIVGPAAGERDRLDARMLPRGGTLAIALEGGRCRYDLRAVLEDGRTFVAPGYDVCAAPRWAIGSGRRQ